MEMLKVKTMKNKEKVEVKGKSKSPLYAKGSFMSKHCKSGGGSPLNKKSCSKY
jgi:hypothetical protein